MKKTVVIGFLGTQLDHGGRGSGRWEKWRPTVGLCRQEDMVVHRLELLHDARNRGLAERVALDIHSVSPETEVRRVEIELRDPWDFEEVYTLLHDFTHDYRFDPEHEDYLVHITTGTHVAQICWFLLTEARYLPGRLIQSSPSRKRESRDTAGSYEIIDLDLSRYDKIAQRFRREQADTVSFLKSGIATRNAHFNDMIARIERVAGRTKAPMLLVGPTGAGKSFLARRVFELKRQRQHLGGRFVEVNCATLRGDSAMSALFGHVKGAFTGAQNERPGLLRAADKGVLFLDEIGELGADEQAMLLKAIEDKRFLPFGGDQEVGSDFQLIAGTNRDLRSWIRQGRFREDLYARINLWTFALPGLAERSEDIEPNLDYELQRYARDYGIQARFNVEARRRYLDFACSPQARWSGNFRELTASVTRMATLATAGRITEQEVRDEIGLLQEIWREEGEGDDCSAEVLGWKSAAALDFFDRCQLNGVLAICRRAGSLSEAGRLLFAMSRQKKKQPNDADRLRKYLARFGVEWEQLRKGGAPGAKEMTESETVA